MPPVSSTTRSRRSKSYFLVLPKYLKVNNGSHTFFKDSWNLIHPKTARAYRNVLRMFSDYLQSTGIPTGDLVDDPTAWCEITRDLIKDFVRWQINRGYAISSVNSHLSALKVLVGLAHLSGSISYATCQSTFDIAGVHNKRDMAIMQALCALAKGNYRNFHANADLKPVRLSPDQVSKLKMQPATPQGCRDAVLICLLVDQGLSVKEISRLSRGDFCLETGRVFLVGKKPGIQISVLLTAATLTAAQQYLGLVTGPDSHFWRGSRKGDHGLTSDPMSERAMIARIGVLGQRVGIPALRARDCQSYYQDTL
ncbi:MAG: site-specific integrase [Anaerolineaceae bacterium]|nr:site-specific integrase [Anaerolineaceae bacterium]